MSRAKKNGRSLNLNIDSYAYEQLDAVCEQLGQTKTMAVERAVLEYAAKYRRNDTDSNNEEKAKNDNE